MDEVEAVQVELDRRGAGDEKWAVCGAPAGVAGRKHSVVPCDEENVRECGTNVIVLESMHDGM